MLNRSIKESAIGLRLLCALIVTVLITGLGGRAFAAEAGGDVETRLKVALVYKLPKFVQWPPETFADTGQVFRLCVLGRPEIVGALEALTGKGLVGRTVAVEQPKADAGALRDCQLLFIGELESLDRAAVRDILGQLAESPTLTVSDVEGFASAGGGVEIYRQGARLALKINLLSTRRAGLLLAAPLLEISTIVEN